ncbi:hypothetical protein Leryth_011761 [Lithospermum erythrorhizon]|nr:hypothetical protein Leryth_011761 [Lithospermum erythrorhizon]
MPLRIISLHFQCAAGKGDGQCSYPAAASVPKQAEPGHPGCAGLLALAQGKHEIKMIHQGHIQWKQHLAFEQMTESTDLDFLENHFQEDQRHVSYTTKRATQTMLSDTIMTCIDITTSLLSILYPLPNASHPFTLTLIQPLSSGQIVFVEGIG